MITAKSQPSSASTKKDYEQRDLNLNRNYSDHNTETYNSNEINNKEEKLAAAKKRLKKFKEEKLNKNLTKIGDTFQNRSSVNNHEIEMINNQSKRSSPLSSIDNMKSDSLTTSPVQEFDDEINSNNHNYHINEDKTDEAYSHLNNFYDKKYKKDLETYKEQLQVHLQTIGILVAEKAELQSTLQQTYKKIEKKQEEIDELNGRLKASRHKINELEKQMIDINDSNTKILNIKREYDEYIENLKVEFNSKLLSNDELKLRINETNEKYQQKCNETQYLSQQMFDLKSQLEMAQLRITQLNTSANRNGNVDLMVDSNNLLTNQLNGTIEKLNEKLAEQTDEIKKLIEQKHDLQNDYGSYVEKLQRQIESLVDQINRMTDERENSFDRITQLERRVIELKGENDKLIELNHKAEIDRQIGNSDERKQQLECEVQYFKQQIEILLVENNHLNGMIVEKDNEASKLRKELIQRSEEEQTHEKLLETIQGEKNALSRAIQQNKELKEQLHELENAYINLTNTNADLFNQLQSEQHLNKQLNINLNEIQNEFNKIKKYESNESKNKHKNCDHDHHDHDEHEHEHNQALKDALNTIENVQMQKLDDWNDETTNENEDKKIQQNPENNNKLNELANLFNTRVQMLELERNQLIEKLNEMQIQFYKLYENRSQIDDANVKLLEQKFTRVMKENADLKEKNQQLEHLVLQLQCETDTIIDYVSLYQIEREKLTHKYRIKDENMNLLNEKLESNKSIINEMNEFIYNNFNSLLNINSQSGDKDGNHEQETNNRKDEILMQNLNYYLQRLNEINNIEMKIDEINEINENYLKTNHNFDKVRPLNSLILCSACEGDLFVV